MALRAQGLTGPFAVAALTGRTMPHTTAALDRSAGHRALAGAGANRPSSGRWHWPGGSPPCRGCAARVTGHGTVVS